MPLFAQKIAIFLFWQLAFTLRALNDHATVGNVFDTNNHCLCIKGYTLDDNSY